MKQVFYFCILFISSLSSDVFDHLKKIENKTSGHSMRNIDFIYMINLDHRPEKFQKSMEKLAPYNIYPFRFPAINGRELSLEVINDIGLKYQPWMTPINALYFISTDCPPIKEKMHVIDRTYFAFKSLGALGCLLSHLSILVDAYNSGYETIWVLEDDIEVKKNPHILSDMIEKLDQEIGKENWDYFFTDKDYVDSQGKPVKSQGIPARPDLDTHIKNRYRKEYCFDETVGSFRKIGARFGTHSMIIRRSGIKKMIDYFNKHRVFFPIDVENYV